MAYPNIEPGYLYTKVEPELPEDISIVSGENNSPIVCVLFDVDSFEFEVDEPWEPGKNDAEYIKLLESSRDEWQKIAQKAIAKLKAQVKSVLLLKTEQCCAVLAGHGVS